MIRRSGAFGMVGVLFASAFVALVSAQGGAAAAASFGDWKSVSAGDVHTCAIRKGGELYCWGRDVEGQVGDGANPNPATSPRRIGTLNDWARVAGGRDHTCAIRTSGKLYCWGSDSSGQLGDGNTSSTADAPKRIGTLDDWSKVDSGYAHSCGIRKNGKLYCWGSNADGQIGDHGASSTADAPKRVGTGADWNSVSTGREHTCGIRQNGKLYCWGGDDKRQVGDGANPDPALYPRRIGSLDDWATVSAGEYHTCAIRKSGKLYCWGFDNFGQVGEGQTTIPLDVPVHIGSLDDWATVAAGNNHTCGARKNGKLYCWGWNSDNQLGDEGSGTASAPRRIGALDDWASLSGGRAHTCGIRKGGSLYCWGRDTEGQVGDGTNPTPAKTPRRI